MKLLERKSELAAIRSLVRHGGLSIVEGGAGLGKTAMLNAACAIASRERRLVLRARGSDLEREFALGVVRQLFERHCADAGEDERAALFAGAARAVRALLVPTVADDGEQDAFAVLHGLYWLTMNIAGRHPVLIAVDDAHWGDDASLRWLAYLAPRLLGPEIAVVVALRPHEPQSQMREVAAVRAAASSTIGLALLTEQAVAKIARGTLTAGAEADACAAIHRATGGNPFYVHELLRALERSGERHGASAIEGALDRGGIEGVALQLGARLRALNPSSLSLAQAIAVLGDDCELRHAATMARMDVGEAARHATELVRIDVLGQDRPPRFIHPIVRHAVVQTLSSADQDAAHRTAARVLHADRAAPGRVAAYIMRLPCAGDAWMAARLRQAAREALSAGAPAAAAELLKRALAEPPPHDQRIDVLREAARAEQQAGRAIACQLLEDALAISEDPLLRPEIASQLAQAYAALFRWTDAVHVLEHALAELRDAPEAVTVGLQSQLVAVGLQDARVAPRALQMMKQLSGRPSNASADALRIAEGMVAILTGRPADEAALPLETALTNIGSQNADWDMQAALWWSLITAERFSAVDTAVQGAKVRADRSGSSRGLVAVYSTLGLLKLRLGALAEADAAGRIALQVLQEGDFTPGLPFAATVLADVAVEGGELDEAQALLDLLPRGSLQAGVGAVLIPAARGRLRLAQGRACEALAEFEACMALWDPKVWGMDMRDAGYLHGRSGAAQALLALGDARRARDLAEAELADTRRFGGRRACGVALRAAGLTRGGEEGLSTLAESVSVLSNSPAALESARSLIEWGGALRRAGRPREARRALAQGLDAAARCGARPLAARAREELKIAGGRPRRDWSVGVEALTPSEMRIVTLAREGRSNRQIAQELYLAIKTVEGHLARAYSKLGIATRAELDKVLR